MTAEGGTAVPDPVAEQAEAVVALLRACLPDGVVAAVALHGSAVAGGLRPDSDLDLFGIVSRRLTDAEARCVVEGLVPISWRDRRPAGWRPAELTLVVHDEVVPWRYPPRLELQYGEWLRDELLAGTTPPASDASPDLALVLTAVRGAARPLVGAPPAELLDPVPHADLVRATLDSLPSLLTDLEADTRNVLLTLARMWVTLRTGSIVPKDVAADWAAQRLPAEHREPMERARAGYRGEVDERWDDRAVVRATADALVGHIRALA